MPAAPDFLQYAPADILKMGQERGLPPEQIAQAVTRHRDNIAAYGQQAHGDVFMQEALPRLQIDTERALADLQISQQGPMGTIGAKLRDVGPAVVGGFMETGGNLLGAGARLVGLPDSIPQGIAATGADLQAEGQRLRPTNPANVTANTIGSGLQQGLGLVATMGAAAPVVGAKAAIGTVPLVMGGIQGGGQGVMTARDMGITSPAGQLAMGGAYGAAEILAERLGGVGSKGLTEAVQQGIAGTLKRAGKTLGSEFIEEPVTGTMQDAASYVGGKFVEDPNRPGFTITGVDLPKLDAAMLERRKQEAIGGAAGGTVFAGLQLALPNAPLPSTQTATPSPTTPNASPAAQMGAGAATVPSTLSRIAAESVAPEEDTGALTAQDLPQGMGQTMSDPQQTPLTPGERAPADMTAPDAIAGVNATPAQTITGFNAQMGAEMPVPSPTANAGAGTGAMVRSPEAQAYAQALEDARLAEAARLRMIDNKAQGMPVIPDSPTGSRDILDFANENPIYLPPGFSEQRNLPEYENLKEAKLPQYWRQFIASGKRGGNPSTVAQRAFDAGFIAEPTADAYFTALREGIDGRKQYRAQFATREKALAAEEKQVVDFEKTQDKLAKKTDTQEVPFEDVLPGDKMTIDGEEAVVKSVESNEDGYLTNVVIEDGKRFGLMQFDPQNRSGILVDEYQPQAARNQIAASDFAPADTAPASLDSLLQGTESIRPRNVGETARAQNADPLGELMGAKLAGEAEQAQGKMAPLLLPKNFTGNAQAGLAAAAQGINSTRTDSKVIAGGSQPPSTTVNNRQLLQTAYQAAMRGSSTQMLPIRAVYEQAKAQNPALTPAQFMAEVQAADAAGTVLLEPFDSPQGVQDAGEFVARNASGVPSTRMMVAAPAGGMTNEGMANAESLASPAELNAAQKANESKLAALGLPTKPGTRIWARGAVGFALKKIAADGSYPATMRAMADLLSKVDLNNLLLKIEGDARLSYAGKYQPLNAGRGEISLNTRVTGRGDTDIVQSLVHELLHHATFRALRSPKNATQRGAIADLEALRKRSLAALSAQEIGRQFDYELSNTDEFIAALFTRADFQTALAAIPADLAPKSLSQRVRSVLDEIFRVLGELVTGKTVQPGSVLEASFSATLRLMREGEVNVQSRLGNAIMTHGPGPVTILQRALRAVKAYHGTPHKVDKFTTAKIGTGEGAQAYGWGLYFAQGKAVAEEYRKNLTNPTEAPLLDGRKLDNKNPAWEQLSGVELAGIQQLAKFDGDTVKAIEAVYAQADEYGIDRSSPSVSGRVESINKYANRVRNGYTQGNLYTVELIPNEDEFLDWDKPLSEQSEKVKAALANYLPTSSSALKGRSDLGKFVGQQIYTWISNSGEVSERSKALAQAGIPGIKYLDAGSRGAGDGSRNFVVFDEKHIRITEENGQPVQGWDNGPEMPALMNPAADSIPEGMAETRSQWRSPNQQENLYDVEPVEVAQAAGVAWLAQTPVETALNAFENAVVPPGMTQARMFYAHGELLKRLAQQLIQGNEVQRMQANNLLVRAGGAWYGKESQEWGRAGKARAVVSDELQTIAPILAIQNVLVQRAKDVVEKRFDGGGEALVQRINELLKRIEALTAGTAAQNIAKGESTPGLKAMLNALRKKMYPGMDWTEIFTDLPSTQKARQLAIYDRLMKDERLQGLTQDDRIALTNELDKAWMRERRTVFNRELTKAGILGEKNASDRLKVKNALPRLLRLMNLGMFNSEMFREVIAKEYGLKVIDAKAAAELRAISEEIQKAPEGLPRRKKEQQLMDRLQSLAGSTFWQVLDSWWTASVLSGWRTQVDIGAGIANGIEDVGLGSIVTALRTGNKDVALRGLGNLFGRIPSAFMEAVDHVTTGNKAMMRNFELEVKQAMEGGNRMASDVGAQMWRDGGWRKVPGAFMIFYGRLLTALDHINSASTREGAKAMAMARHPELYQKALRISAADKQAARQQARLELTGGAMPATQQERLEETARMREILEQGIPTEALAEATEIGRAAALQGEPTGLGGGLLDMVNAAVGIVARKAEAMGKRPELDAKSQKILKVLQGTAPLAKAITGTKFARTLAHSLNRTLSYVPGVGAYAVGQQGRTGAFGDILAAKQVIGTLVGIALYLAFDDDDDERGIEDGWKDKTPQEKAQLYAQGKQPFTVWERDEKGRVRSFNYQQWGIAGIVNTVAAMLKQKGSEAGVVNVLMSSLVQGGMSFTDKAQLQGLQTIFGEGSRSTDPVKGIAGNLNKWAAQTVGGLVPRLAKDIDMVASPELRDSSFWWQKWTKEVPMLRQLTSGKRIDILGGDVLLDRGPLSRVTQLGTADPAYRMLGRLNAKDVWLPDPSQGQRVVKLNDGTRRDMTPAEKDRYQRLTGQFYRKYIEEEGAQLLQMKPADAQDRISTVTKNLRNRAAYQATH